MWRGGTLLACAVLALTPAPATAKKKHPRPVLRGPVVTAAAAGNPTSAAGEISTAVANCPAGTRVISGGFEVPPITSPTRMAITGSYRGGPSSWTVSAITGGNTAPHAAMALAYCRRSSLAITEATSTGTLSGATQPGSADATCPSGTQLVGGGFQTTTGPTSSDFAVVVSAFASTASTWSVIAYDNAAPAQTITAHAYCLARVRTPLRVSSEATASLANRTTMPVVSPACPPRTKKERRQRKPARLLSAGGFRGNLSPPSVVFNASLVGPSGWAIQVENVNGTNASVTALSQGICV
jgi:hypothetical protein